MVKRNVWSTEELANVIDAALEAREQGSDVEIVSKVEQAYNQGFRAGLAVVEKAIGRPPRQERR